MQRARCRGESEEVECEHEVFAVRNSGVLEKLKIQAMLYSEASQLAVLICNA